MLSFKPVFSLSSIIFIKRLFSSSSLSAIRVVSSIYLRLLIFLPAILIPACASSSPAFHMMYSAYTLNKQGDNIQPWLTPGVTCGLCMGARTLRESRGCKHHTWNPPVNAGDKRDAGSIGKIPYRSVVRFKWDHPTLSFIYTPCFFMNFCFNQNNFTRSSLPPASPC